MPPKYSAYGLVLASDWAAALPALRSDDGRAVDVTILNRPMRLHDAGAYLQDEPTDNEDRWYRQGVLPDGSIYLRWGLLFRFLVAPDGSTIFGEALPAFRDEPLQVYLLAHALSFALIRQGLEPLHVTAVVDLEGNAIGLTADPGAGKSTLAAGCLRAGYQLLSDDLLLVRDTQGVLRVDPGPPRIKLFPEVAHAVLGANAAAGIPMNEFTSKLILPLEAGWAWAEEARLVALYVLRQPSDGSRRVEIRRLGGRSAFLELTHATFNDGIREPARLERQFRFASGLVERLPVLSLSYPRDLDLLDEVVKTVWRDARSRHAPAQT